MNNAPGRPAELVRGEVLVGGRWYRKDEHMVSLNPATGEAIGTAPLCIREDVEMAVAAARAALPAWSQLPLARRFGYLEMLKALVGAEGDAIAALVTRENGKPLVESHFIDVGGALDFLAGLLEGGPALLADRKVRATNPILWGKSHLVRRVPLGVVGVISPWNLPFAIAMGQILPALAAGNTVVFKPSELTPLVGVKIATLFHRTGIPPGVFNLVTGGKETGAFLVDADIDGLLFTGSTSVGRAITGRLGPKMVPTEMELGGKDAFLVLPDAHYERTVQGAVWSGCFGSGQACSSSERYYVPRSWMDRFPGDLAERVRALKVGDGMDESVQVGPMVSEAQLLRVETQVADAVSRGARLLCGGRRLPGPGFFYEPAVLVDVPPDCALMREETFGPVIPILPYDDLEEAIGWCNDTPFGLSASIWTADVDAGLQIARRLEVGSVWINESSYTHSQAQCPWGGRKASGRGRTHWLGSLHEVTVTQLIGIDRGRRPSEIWWYPYTADGLDLFRRYRLLAGKGLLGKALHLVPMARDLIRLRADHS